MKKTYTLIAFAAISSVAFAQRTATPGSNILPAANKYAVTSQMAIDTITNLEADDTLTIYNSDTWGYALGHNNYNDMGWAEKYRISGAATVTGGAYYLFANTIQTPSANGYGKVYSVGVDLKPALQLGLTANIPYSSVPLAGSDLTYFMFGTPIAVADSFFMAFELDPYTTTQDTIGIVSSTDGNRSMGGNVQNAAMWNDGLWYDEATENWGLVVTYMLMPIIDFPTAVGSISNNALTLFAAYPSPSNSNVNISYNLPRTSDVTIKVMDMTGKAVMQFDNQGQAEGSHVQTVDVNTLAAGTYLYSISANGSMMFSKFVVTK
jgi:hypothetical protein